MSEHPLRGFQGYRMPGYTQIPDQLLDEQLHLLSHAELKVLLYIMRHTLGYKRDGDHLSARQIAEGLVRRDGSRVDNGTGCEIATVRRTVKRLEEVGLITVRREKTQDGDAEMNYYGVHIADGVVSPRHHRGVPATPPGWCSRDTLQETRGSKQETQQQEPSAGDPTAVVVASASPLTANDLASRLAALGVAKATARKLLKERDPGAVYRWLCYTEDKLRNGWVPRETPAAWIVAAVQSEDWVIPDWFQTPEEQAEAEVMKQRVAAAERRSREEAEARERQEAEDQRRALEAELGVDDGTRDLWDRTRALLQERGQWTAALFSAYLLPLRNGVATVATPVAFFGEVIGKRADAIRAALQEVTGQDVGRVEVQFVEGGGA